VSPAVLVQLLKTLILNRSNAKRALEMRCLKLVRFIQPSAKNALVSIGSTIQNLDVKNALVILVEVTTEQFVISALVPNGSMFQPVKNALVT
jgi:hypothetical protein